MMAQQTTAQYSVASWGHKDGLPSTFIDSVVQTRDGFLWLGTDDGLVRFDGVQFTPWHHAGPNGELLGQVRVLHQSRQGELLLGTGTGLVGSEKNSGLEATQLDSTVQSIQEAADGSLWVATSASLWHLSAESLEPTEPPIQLPDGWVSGPLQSRDGKEWIATRTGLFSVDAGRLVRTAQGAAWLLMTPDGHAAWLDRQGNFRLLPNGAAYGDKRVPATAPVSTFLSDSSRCLWIGTLGDGLFHIAGTGAHARVRHYTRSDGLSSNFVRSIFEDREQNLWIATENGLDRLRRNKVLSLTRQDGLFSDSVRSIAAANNGSVWLATPDGLQQFLGSQSSVDRRGVKIFSLLVDHDQRLWAGTSAGLLLWKDGGETALPGTSAFTAVTALAQDDSGVLWFLDAQKGLFQEIAGHAPVAVTNPALLHQTVTSMVSARGGAVWLGLANGSILEEQRGQFRAWSSREGLSGGVIHHLSIGPDGELWVATERGLCFLTGQRFACRHGADGLPGNRVLWALPDSKGDLWLGYNIGVARMNAQQLREPPDHQARLDLKLFDDADGIVNSPDLEGNAPAAFARDGRLWFTTAQGVGVLDPERLQPNLLPPPVQILGLQADGQNVALVPPVNLPPLTRSLQFFFTGVCLTVPRKVHIRYQIERFDREWHDGEGLRQASYTNLPPGHYIFRVLAANNDGVWNNTGAALAFYLAPAYFQTLWFRLLCLTAALLAVAGLYRLRLRSAKRLLRLRFEERMEERTRIAQDLHDHLIQEMVGICMQLEVADELTSTGSKAKSALQRAMAHCGSAIRRGRLTLHSLRSRPVTAAALVESLRRTAEAYSREARSTVEYRIEGEEQLLQPEAAEDLSELGQEALRNALKHAGEAAIRVRLRYGSSTLELLIRDEGPGMTEEVQRKGIPGHFGLAGMRERATRIAGEFSIVSMPGKGTAVQLVVPAEKAYQNRNPSGNGRHGHGQSEPGEKAQ